MKPASCSIRKMPVFFASRLRRTRWFAAASAASLLLAWPVQGHANEFEFKQLNAPGQIRTQIHIPDDVQPIVPLDPKIVQPGVSLPAIRVTPGGVSNEAAVVGIRFRDEGGIERICSGLLLDGRHVLTAKHCTCHPNTYEVTNARDFPNDEKGWRDAVLEPGFQAGRPCRRMADMNAREGNDIAILTLSASLGAGATCASLLDNILPLPRWWALKQGGVTIAGYGATEPDGTVSGTRNSAVVPVNSRDCSPKLAQSLGCVAYREMIMGLSPPDIRLPDSCAGDSGGPAYIKVDGKLIPVALVSRAINIRRNNICGAGGIYTILGRSDILAWLHARLDSRRPEGCD